jgi:hypothetical protein
MLLAGLAVFALASLAAAYAGDVQRLIAARAVMGAEAAFIMRATLSLLNDGSVRDAMSAATLVAAVITWKFLPSRKLVVRNAVYRRRVAILLGGALALGLTATAPAHEFTPSWGYGFIDDAPFNEPGSGALLPITQVFPRGYIRDTLVDGRDVRLSVLVFTPGNPKPVKDYHVDEGDFRNVSIDRPLDVAPSPISYLRYDFCRFNPSNGVVEVCEEFHRIGRPDPTPPPTPTPTPTASPTATPTPTVQSSPPPPADADGDGFPATTDCWDQNATVYPGAREIAGNGIDDDCAGGDAPARLVATIKNKWTKLGHRLRVDDLRVLEAPAGAQVEVRCAGRRCPFARRATATDAKGNADLIQFFKRRLRPKITIDIRVTAPNTIGKVGRFVIKRPVVPNLQRLCLPPGASDPQRCE